MISRARARSRTTRSMTSSRRQRRCWKWVKIFRMSLRWVMMKRAPPNSTIRPPLQPPLRMQATSKISKQYSRTSRSCSSASVWPWWSACRLRVNMRWRWSYEQWLIWSACFDSENVKLSMKWIKLSLKLSTKNNQSDSHFYSLMVVLTASASFRIRHYHVSYIINFQFKFLMSQCKFKSEIEARNLSKMKIQTFCKEDNNTRNRNMGLAVIMWYKIPPTNLLKFFKQTNQTN